METNNAITTTPELDLDKLDLLCQDATPGPWVYYRGSIISFYTERSELVGTFDGGEDWPQSYDINFITEARDAMPALISEVRRLRGAR